MLPKSLLFSLLLLSGCVVIPIGDLLKGPALEEQVLVEGDGFFSKDKIAIIEVDGVITGGDFTGLIVSRENTVAEVKARLVKASKDTQVRGVVLRISSPGGEVTACDTIHHEIVEFKKSAKVPVVAAIVDEGASGGYYVACAADRILAHPTSVVGSIGVLLQTFNLAGLLEKIGVETEAIKSADKKDLLSPFRGRSEEEIAVLNRVVQDLYRRFVEVVAARPGGPGPQEALKLADGRIFSGKEAQNLKLVDQVGYVSDAIAEVKERAGIDRKPTIVRYARIARSGANIYTLSGTGPEAGGRGAGLQVSLRSDLFSARRFLYLWEPSAP